MRLVRTDVASRGSSNSVSGLTFLRRLLRAKTLSQACSEGRRGQGGEGERWRPRFENLSNFQGENNVYAGAFHCSFTVNFVRNVAFPNEIIYFLRSGAKMSQATLREAT